MLFRSFVNVNRIAAMTVARVWRESECRRAWSCGRYLAGFVTVSWPRQSAATLRVPSSCAWQFSNSGVQSVSEILASSVGGL